MRRPHNIEVAKLHAAEGGLSIDYRATTAEDLAERARSSTSSSTWKWSSMSPMSACSWQMREMVKPGGIMFVATINRTLKALGLAIIGAEYVLRWLPRGTHRYGRLVRPEELEKALSAAGLTIIDRTGVATIRLPTVGTDPRTWTSITWCWPSVPLPMPQIRKASLPPPGPDRAPGV